MKKLLTIIPVLALAFASCSKPAPTPPPFDWGEDEKPDTSVSKPSFTAPDGSKPRFLWVDAGANFKELANDELKIKAELQKIADCGFTDVIVDVRPSDGVVLFNSKIAPPALKLGAWINGKYQFVYRTASFDYLEAFIRYGHRFGLRVNAAINTFTGGYKYSYGLGEVGPVFDGSIPKEWASVLNTSQGLASEMDLGGDGTRFLSPANDAVCDYLLGIIAEVASYDVDGIILDRCRYGDAGLMADFSESARTKFEEYTGNKVTDWPSEVFSPGKEDLPYTLTPLQKQWMSFRVKTIHDFVEKASAKVHEVNPDCRFGCYVGAWFSSYYYSGVNYASPKYNVRNYDSYKWANAEYSKYGYADHCDFMMLGCYAGTDSVYGNWEWSMQGFCKLGRKLFAGDTVFAGGPDIGNGSGFENGGCEKVIPQTVDACISEADGYFCFDLCHIRMFDYWDAYKKAFKNYITNNQ